jgi:spermidine/putrescine transport system permease protein
MKPAKVSKAIFAAFIYAFFYFPIAILIIYSFNNSAFSLVWHGFTWQWYAQLWQDSDLQIVTLHSVIVGVLASTCATLLGTLAAVSLYRYKFFGKKLIHSMIFILIVSPDIVLAISLLILFSAFKISLGFWTLLFAHITFCLPFVAVTVYGRLAGFDKNIFEAAKDLGASDSKIFFKIITPLLWPAILAGWLLSFSLSLDDVIISYFVTGPDFNILPLQIYSMVRLGVKPEINALCSVLFGVTLLFVCISQLALKRNSVPSRS